MYLPLDFVPKRDLMTPRISGMDIFVMLIHVWYTQSSCLSVFLQFKIFLGLFLLKKRKFDVLTPVFGPNYPKTGQSYTKVLPNDKIR